MAYGRVELRSKDGPDVDPPVNYRVVIWSDDQIDVADFAANVEGGDPVSAVQLAGVFRRKYDCDVVVHVDDREDVWVFLCAELGVPTWRPSEALVALRYKMLHSRCPECQGTEHESTCVGHVFSNLATAVDANSAKCKCGWSGVVHDLKPFYEGDA